MPASAWMGSTRKAAAPVHLEVDAGQGRKGHPAPDGVAPPGRLQKAGFGRRKIAFLLGDITAGVQDHGMGIHGREQRGRYAHDQENDSDEIQIGLRPGSRHTRYGPDRRGR